MHFNRVINFGYVTLLINAWEALALPIKQSLITEVKLKVLGINIASIKLIIHAGSVLMGSFESNLHFCLITCLSSKPITSNTNKNKWIISIY